VFWIFVVNLFVAFVAVWSTFAELTLWQLIVYVYPLVLNVCGVALAYWVAKDGKEIDRLVEEVILKLDK